MKDADRGKIRNRECAGQLKDFSGLRFGKITPTDIDGFVDFQNMKFVFFEIKYGTTPMPYGQRLGYERLSDACERAGIRTLVIVAHHEIKAPQDIDVAILPVTLVRFLGKWKAPNVPHTVRTAFEAFLKWTGRLDDGTANAEAHGGAGLGEGRVVPVECPTIRSLGHSGADRVVGGMMVVFFFLAGYRGFWRPW